jgi:hypothetical protein
MVPRAPSSPLIRDIPQAPRTLSLPPGVPDEPSHSWNDLAAAVGPASSDDLAAYSITVPADQLTELGTHIRSERILTDARRWSSQLVDFEDRPAHPPVVGYTTGMLRVLVRECITLRGMLDTSRTEAGARDLAAAGNSAAAAAIYNRALTDIDTLEAALHSAARGDVARDAVIDAARGKVGSYPEAAATLRGLVKLATSWLADAKSPVAKRLDAGGLDDAMLAQMDETADGVEGLGEIATGPRPSGQIPQASIDHQDGVVLTHMRLLMNVFDAAHAKDATVPRLVPVSTRRILGRHKHVVAADPTPTVPTKPALGAHGSRRGAHGCRWRAHGCP